MDKPRKLILQTVLERHEIKPYMVYEQLGSDRVVVQDIRQTKHNTSYWLVNLKTQNLKKVYGPYKQ